MNGLLTYKTHPFLWIGLGLFALLSSGCSSSRDTASKPGRVQHIVLCWLKEPGNEESHTSLIEATFNLRSIPGVLRVHAGTPLASDRPIVDDSFDVGIIIVLENREALQPYLDHPAHTEAVREILAPLTERILIYDVLEE